MIVKQWLKLNSSVASFLLALLCVFVLIRLQIPNLNKILSKSKSTSTEQLSKELKIEKEKLTLLKNLPSFGFNNLIADSVMLNFIQYFGDDEERDRTGYDLTPKYFEIIVDRDPRFLEAYIFLSTSITIYAGKPEISVALMEKGLKSLSPDMPPKYYYVWRYKATDELLFLNRGKDAQRSFEMAAKWAALRPDAESQNVAANSQRTASFLAKNPNSKSGQVGAWSMVLQNAVDDRVRKLAIDRIQKLGGQVILTPQGALQIILPKTD